MTELVAIQRMVIEKFATAKPDGVKVWDFGENQTVMPVPAVNGSYLTSSICMLYTEGTDKSAMEGRMLPRQDQEVIDYGHGWKFIAVEFSPVMTEVGELMVKLEKAKEKLLGR